jgi:hypothetical protein
VTTGAGVEAASGLTRLAQLFGAGGATDSCGVGGFCCCFTGEGGRGATTGSGCFTGEAGRSS